MSCRRLLGLVLGGVAVLAGHGAPAHAQQNLTWAAGAVGGGWYAISNGMAELMREKAGLSIKVIAGGGAQNAVLIQKGEAEIGRGCRRCSGPQSTARTRTEVRRCPISAPTAGRISD